MKQNKTKKQTITHTTSQKILGGLALCGLFICGLMVGLGLQSKQAPTHTEPEQITNPAPVVSTSVPTETCAVIEDLLLERLYPIDSQDIRAHEYNITIYEKLVMNGCSENQMKYHKAAQREREIVAALQESDTSDTTCEQIETLLLGQLPDPTGASEHRIQRAKIYANLSERGCPQNSEKYVDLATQELEIARALRDDEFGTQDTIEVVETYKRLNMQATAQEFFDIAKKLTDPAIDFILEVEKIINEQ